MAYRLLLQWIFPSWGYQIDRRAGSPASTAPSPPTGRRRRGRFRLTVTLPVNTTADVWIQAGRPEDVTHTGARFLRVEDGCAVFAVGSGHHRFET